ncbi:MAG: hypothetical protein NHG36_20060 [Chromatiaceae bacterium]|nr:hypothetical protein [Candidatus Thioaporhodococcus sediminis]
MTAPATALLTSLQTHLAGITAANGYEVTVASVSVGHSALAGDTDGPFPALSLAPVRDTPQEALPGSWFQRWDREIILEVATVEMTAWDAEIDAVWDAIRHRLTSWSSVITAWGPAEFIQPFVAGELCGLRVPLTLTYQLNLSE